MARHKKLRFGVSELAGKSFTPAHVRDDFKIFTGHAVQGGRPKANQQGKSRCYRRQRRGRIRWAC